MSLVENGLTKTHPVIKACIFDLDGTIVDSEPLYTTCDTLFLNRYGIEYSREFNERMIGRGAMDFFKAIEEEFPESPLNDLSLDERITLKDKEFLEYAKMHVRAFPAMDRLIRLLHERGIPLAVASGSSLPVIEAILGYVGLRDYFDSIVSASEVARGKPEPDVFLETAQRLKQNPENCLVFEDSTFGIIAAKRARMTCIGLPSNDYQSRGFDRGIDEADINIPGGADSLNPDSILSQFFQDH